MIEKPLPRDQFAERSVLGSVLMRPEPFDKVAWLTPQDFALAPHSTIWRALADMRGVGVDLVTVLHWLEARGLLDAAGGVVYLSGLVDGVPDIANVERYARIVREKAALRQLIRETERLQVEAFNGGANVGELLGHAVETLTACRPNVEHGRSADRLAINAAHAFEERLAGRSAGYVPTGWPSLDAALGGWQRGALALVGARPSCGKTACLLCSALTLVRGDADARVILFALEQPASALALRLVANLAGVPLWAIREPSLASAAQKDALADGFRMLGSLNERFVIDDTTADIGTIVGTIRREAKQGLTLAAVDYLQLVGGARGEKRYLELGSISRQLVLTARETGVSIVGAVQLGREAEDRSPTLRDLRESGNLEQDARQVVLLDRPSRRGESVPVCELRAIVSKNSEGESGTDTALHFHLPLQRIEDSELAETQHCPDCNGRIA